MRKLMVLAAMLAMALMVASPAMASSFAFAGDTDDGFGNNGFGNNGNNGSGNNGFGNNGFDDDFGGSQQQFGSVFQINTGDANAAATDGSVAIASSGQDFSLDQSQFSTFSSGFDNDSDDDGIFDEFDFVILAGDFDNNGLVDDFEF